jgi:hypothetical protein
MLGRLSTASESPFKKGASVMSDPVSELAKQLKHPDPDVRAQAVEEALGKMDDPACRPALEAAAALVIRGKEAFSLMAEGRAHVGPAHFDRLMAELGLTPADIRKTPDEIAAAKKTSIASWGKYLLRRLTMGDLGPEDFHHAMADLGLTLADIGTTADAIADTRKRVWKG